ncbi:MAG: hypothetical protein GDA45_02615 [Chromatiales bacterium]|nr:hypothetical protein [Chromatiales bacterium]
MKSKFPAETTNPFAEVDHAQSTFKVSLQIQDIAQHHRFDWCDAKEVIAKLYEELEEIIEADASTPKRNEHIREELGDFLFTAISLARHYGIDPEVALTEANYKFEYRFQKMAVILEANGLNFNCASRQQLEEAWHKVKSQAE